MSPRKDTRAQMVASAALLLREHGVAGTSFARVIEHCDGPRGSIGHHFPGGKGELVRDAVLWAGAAATALMRHVSDRGGSAADMLAAVCEFYRRALVDTDFAAGCPVGAVAQESFGDGPVRDAVRDVFADWTEVIAGALVRAGRDEDAAVELAQASIAGVEGALLVARVERTTAALDGIEHLFRGLLAG